MMTLKISANGDIDISAILMHTVVFKNYETSEKQAKLIIFIIQKSRD